MKLKSKDVHFKDSSMAMAFAFVVVNNVFIKYGYECVIASVNDGVHSEKSKHFTDEAFDFRSKHLPDTKTKEMILAELKLALPNFDVLLENLNEQNEHYHLEFDDKTIQKAFA